MINKGFIMPNGKRLFPNGFNLEHDDIAMDYIKNNKNLMKKFMEGNISNPSDFLIACGALRIGFNSQRIVIVSIYNREPNITIKLKYYEKKGYKVLRVSENLILFPETKFKEENYRGYGRTVIKIDGKYKYNPFRDGD